MKTIKFFSREDKITLSVKKNHNSLKKYSLFVCTVLAVIFAGCKTLPQSESDEKKAPSERETRFEKEEETKPREAEDMPQSKEKEPPQQGKVEETKSEEKKNPQQGEVEKTKSEEKKNPQQEKVGETKSGEKKNPQQGEIEKVKSEEKEKTQQEKVEKAKLGEKKNPQQGKVEETKSGEKKKPKQGTAEKIGEKEKTPTKKEEVLKSVSRRLSDPGLLTAEELTSFFMSQNPNADKEMIIRMSGYYIEEAATEGINSDCAFAQMCLETGYLRFGNLVSPEMHNYCGLGAIDEEHRGEVFETEQLGVRAHIQHLHAYATTEDHTLVNKLIDNRYKWVRPRGKAPTIFELAGTWAVDPEYGEKLDGILERMAKF